MKSDNPRFSRQSHLLSCRLMSVGFYITGFWGGRMGGREMFSPFHNYRLKFATDPDFSFPTFLFNFLFNSFNQKAGRILHLWKEWILLVYPKVASILEKPRFGVSGGEWGRVGDGGRREEKIIWSRSSRTVDPTQSFLIDLIYFLFKKIRGFKEVGQKSFNFLLIYSIRD